MVGKLYKGLQGLVKSRKIQFVAGEGRFEAPNAVTVGERPLRRQEGRARQRQLRPHAARPRHRRPDHHQQRGAAPRRGAGPRRRPRRRRDRRRVRVGVQELRRRGDGRRGAAPAGPRTRTSSRPSSWSARSAGARSPSRPACKFTGAKQNDSAVTVSLESGEDLEADVLLVAVGRGPNTANAGYEEAGVHDGARLRAHRRPAAHQPARRLRGRRHRPRPPARPPRLRSRASSSPRTSRA